MVEENKPNINYLPPEERYYAPLEEGRADIEGPLLRMSEIGTSIIERPQQSFVDTLQAAIRKGASWVELALNVGENMGADFYGKQKRRDIKDLARVNEVEIASVHTPVGVISNLSGLHQDEAGNRGFSDGLQQRQLMEFKKSAEFAADITDGAALVVHTAEFPRPISKYEEFEVFPGGEEKEAVYIVDEESGQVTGVRGDMEVSLPIYETDEHGNYIDSEGKPIIIRDDMSEAEKEKALLRRVYKKENGQPVVETKKVKEYLNELKSQGYEKPEIEFYKRLVRRKLTDLYNQSLYYGSMAARQRYQLEMEEREFKKKLQELKSAHAADEKLKQEIEDLEREHKLRVEQIKHEIEHADNASSAAKVQLDDEIKQVLKVKPVDEYGLERSAEGFAEAGIIAMNISKERGLKKGLFVAPENVFPEMGYGSHPEELITIVEKARERMAQKLIEQGYDKKTAEKEAEEHIKATIDTEHLGMWKRYLKRKPGESEQDFEKRFEKWYKTQLKKLADKNIIGHVHLADGFGYGHGNLPVGDAGLPIKTAVEYLKEKGYEGKFLSEGYGDPERQLTAAWEYFGSPIYRVYTGTPTAAPSSSWTDIQGSYLSRKGSSANYIFGDYAPSKDYKLWSEVPLE